jgi:hypothetical protein
MDFETGSRYMQTFKKLPIHVPNMNINSTIREFNMFGNIVIAIYYFTFLCVPGIRRAALINRFDSI